MDKMHREDVLEKIKTSGDLTKETEEALKTAIGEFKKLK